MTHFSLTRPSKANKVKSIALASCALWLTACAETPAVTPLSDFHHSVQSLCGQSFQGQVISQDAADESWRKEVLTLGPIKCVSDNMTSMALDVGADKSRVWSLEMMEQGQALEFKHAHTLTDGSPDPVTNYGGMASGDSTSTRVVFPVDQESIDNFRENGLDASVTNVWSFTLAPAETLTYELRRENREFIAVFDLSEPLLP
jgi:hypothetical protein